MDNIVQGGTQNYNLSKDSIVSADPQNLNGANYLVRMLTAVYQTRPL